MAIYATTKKEISHLPSRYTAHHHRNQQENQRMQQNYTINRRISSMHQEISLNNAMAVNYTIRSTTDMETTII